MSIWNCLFMPEQMKKLLHEYFYQHVVKMDLIWKVFIIPQQITTFVMQSNLLTYRGMHILNWLIEAHILFSRYAKKNISASWLPGMNELKVKYTRRLTFFKILFPNCTHLLLLKNLTFTIISLIYFRNFMINCRLFKKTIAHSFAASSKSKNGIILQRGQWKELCLFCFSSRTHLPLSS